MELASQECCLHSVMFIRRNVTFVLVIIFKSILEQRRKIFNRTT